MLCSATLAGTILVAAPSGAFAAGAPVVAAEQNAVTLSTSPLDAPQQFEACAASGLEAPKAIKLGSNLGPGISERIDKATLQVLNTSMKAAEKKPLPSNVYAVRYLDSGRIVALNKKGAVVQEISAATSSNVAAPGLEAGGKLFAAKAILHPEVKRIIGACLGFGGAGGMGFEALVRYLANPINAAKFVIRRIGIAGAISCIGGVIWLYI